MSAAAAAPAAREPAPLDPYAELAPIAAYVCFGCSAQARHYYQHGFWFAVPEHLVRALRAAGLTSDGLCPACARAFRAQVGMRPASPAPLDALLAAHGMDLLADGPDENDGPDDADERDPDADEDEETAPCPAC